jgi:hypothetical protein
LSQWGFIIPRRVQIHTHVRFRFTIPANNDLRFVGNFLDPLGTLRNRADYETSAPGVFANHRPARFAVADAQGAIDRLDAINADPARVAAAVAAIRAAFASP